MSGIVLAYPEVATDSLHYCHRACNPSVADSPPPDPAQSFHLHVAPWHWMSSHGIYSAARSANAAQHTAPTSHHHQ